MTQCNFVANVLHDEHAQPLHDEVILNSDLMADMAASHEFAHQYISPCEMSIGGGYSIKLEGEKKNLYKNRVECEPSVTPESVISDINQSRGNSITSRIGITLSENYGLFMSLDKSFQFYKRVRYVSGGDKDD